MRRVRLCLLLSGVVIAGGLLSVSGAQAHRMSVKQAVRAENRALRPQLAHMIRVANNPSSKPAKVARAVSALQNKVLHAAQVVSAASAGGSSRIASGQRNWSAAARELARGLGQLVAALRAAQNNQAAAAKRDARKAMRTINAAEVRGNRADRQLGVS